MALDWGQVVGVGIFPNRFLARNTQIVWLFVTRVHGEVPPGAMWHGWQVKADRLSAGIEHQVQSLVLAFVAQAGKPLFFRVRLVGQIPVWTRAPRPSHFGRRGGSGYWSP